MHAPIHISAHMYCSCMPHSYLHTSHACVCVRSMYVPTSMTSTHSCAYIYAVSRMYIHIQACTCSDRHAFHSNTYRCVCLHVKVYVHIWLYRQCLAHVYMHTGLHAYMPAHVNTRFLEVCLYVSIHVPRTSVFLLLCASPDMYLHILVHHLLVLWPYTYIRHLAHNIRSGQLCLCTRQSELLTHKTAYTKDPSRCDASDTC